MHQTADKGGTFQAHDQGWQSVLESGQEGRRCEVRIVRSNWFSQPQRDTHTCVHA